MQCMSLYRFEGQRAILEREVEDPQSTWKLKVIREVATQKRLFRSQKTLIKLFCGNSVCTFFIEAMKIFRQ